MSDASPAATPSTFDRDDSPRRDNFWGDVDGEEDDVDDEVSHYRTSEAGLKQKISQHKAHRILKGVAPLYCGATLQEAPYAPSISADLDAHEVSELMGLLFDGPGISGERDRLAMHRHPRPAELSDSDCYPPAETPDGVDGNGTSRYHAARVNEETGYLNYGMYTWIELGDVDWETLREAIVTYAEEEFLSESKREFLIERAKSMKKNPNCDLSDVEILSEVLLQFTREFSN